MLDLLRTDSATKSLVFARNKVAYINSMRIAIGQLWQETNTLNPLPTTLADFEAFGIYEGAEILETLQRNE